MLLSTEGSDYLGKVETVLCIRVDILASDKPETYAWILEDFGR